MRGLVWKIVSKHAYNVDFIWFKRPNLTQNSYSHVCTTSMLTPE